MPLVNKELKNGIMITFITKYANVIVQLILSSILARLLTPEEYGIIAVILVFITFFSLLSEMGIGPAIIQEKKITTTEISTLFNLTVLIGIFLATIFFFLSEIISKFYNDINYILIVKTMSISIFFNTIIIVPQNILRREKKLNY